MDAGLLADLVASAREGLRDDWEWRDEVVTEAIVTLADQVAKCRALLEAIVRSYAVVRGSTCDGGCGSALGAGCVPADLERVGALIRELDGTP